MATGYAYQLDTNTADYEEDHLIPLELGGSPMAVLNLWPEPYNVTDGARTKDQIENKLNDLVCNGALALATAQRALAANWFNAYNTYIETPAPRPTATTVKPPAATTAMPTTPPLTRPSALTCTATVSNATPSDYSTVDVIVGTGIAGATVTASAHYKSTTTTHTGTAGGNGTADIAFQIARATSGYQVNVAVTVSAAGAAKNCSTAFTPR